MYRVSEPGRLLFAAFTWAVGLLCPANETTTTPAVTDTCTLPVTACCCLRTPRTAPKCASVATRSSTALLSAQAYVQGASSTATQQRTAGERQAAGCRTTTCECCGKHAVCPYIYTHIHSYMDIVGHPLHAGQCACHVGLAGGCCKDTAVRCVLLGAAARTLQGPFTIKRTANTWHALIVTCGGCI